MKYSAFISVMPHEELLDPQGKAVKLGLQNLGFKTVEKVRVGKSLRLEFDAANEEEARVLVENACKQLLVNPIMEGFTFTLKEN